jgi:hypothetical protein
MKSGDIVWVGPPRDLMYAWFYQHAEDRKDDTMIPAGTPLIYMRKVEHHEMTDWMKKQLVVNDKNWEWVLIFYNGKEYYAHTADISTKPVEMQTGKR